MRSVSYKYNSFVQESKESGWWVYLIRNRLTRILAFFLANFTEVSPNFITFFSFFISIAGGAFYLIGSHWAMIIGAISYELAQILDGVDGLIARVKKKSSAFGAYLDFFLDRVRNFILLFFLTVGQGTNDPFIFILGICYIGIKEVYLVSIIYQEKVLKDFSFPIHKGRDLLRESSKGFIKKYLSFTKRIKICPYYTDLDTDFLVFVLFPILDKVHLGLEVGSIAILLVTIILNFAFFNLLKERR